MSYRSERREVYKQGTSSSNPTPVFEGKAIGRMAIGAHT